jgi:hypothetical protein
MSPRIPPATELRSARASIGPTCLLELLSSARPRTRGANPRSPRPLRVEEANMPIPAEVPSAFDAHIDHLVVEARYARSTEVVPGA